MKSEDQNPELNHQKLELPSNAPGKKDLTRKRILTKLIFIVCMSIIGFVGINFISCNFLIPGSINRANVMGGLKNPPTLDCKESERRGFEVLLTILTTVIALKTRLENEE